MMPINKTQISLIVGSVVVIVLLLFTNTKLPKKENASPMASDHAGEKSANINTLVENTKNGLSPDQKQKIEKLEESLKSTSNQQKSFENMIHQWDSLRQPMVAAYYMEQAAIAASTEGNWKQAGDRYYAATRFVGEADRPILFNKALECFQKTVDINPNNVEAKVSLASCYVEGTTDPMKGIGMLRDIEKTDSNNVNLQLSFAFFSEKSGQWDRAIARFKKVLKIKPQFIEAYLHLADAYEQKGDKQKAIESLEKYITLTDDVTIKTEVQNYIDKLKH
jgi:tetratricopeptide (TPR) repeat protein